MVSVMINCMQNIFWSVSRFGAVLVLMFGFSVALAQPDQQAASLKPVSIQLHWNHQFEFAGIYAALQQGFYAQAGLDVTIKPWQAGVDVLDSVLSRRVDFGIGYSQLIVDYAKGIPIRLLLATFQYSPVILIANRPISGLRDLSHSKVMRQEILQVLSLLKMARYDGATDIQERPSSGQLSEFLSGEVDAISAYITNEPFVLESMKVPFYVVDPKSYGVQSYDDLVFTSQALVEQDPETVERFKQATIEGWRYALDHPEAIVDLILKDYSVAKSREALLAEAKATEKHVRPAQTAIGSLDAVKLQAIATNAKELGLLTDTELNKLDTRALIFRNEKPLLTAEEQAYLRDHPVIAIGNDRDWAPFEFINAQGEYDGMAAEYFHRFERLLGVTFAVNISKNWSETLNAAMNGQIPVLSSAVATPERSQYFNFTRAYLAFPMVLVAREGEHYVEGFAQLSSSQRVAVVRGYWSEDYLKKHYPQLPLLVVDSVVQGLAAVLTGKAYALSDNLGAINYAIKAQGLSGLQVIGQAEHPFELAIGVHKSEPVLFSILQKALNQISLEEERDIYNHWQQLMVATQADFASVVRPYLPISLALAIVVLVLFVLLVWSRQRHRLQSRLAQAQAQVSALQAQQAQAQAHQASFSRQEQADFFAMVVHEVKTPIAMMDGALQSLVLIDACRQPAEVQKRQLRLRRGVDRLNSLVDRFLLKSKLEDVAFQPRFQLLSMSSLVQLWQQQFMGSQQLHVLCPEAFNLQADDSLLQLAISNLIDNASKYSPSDATIRLTITQQQADEKQWCHICVIDQGRGIDEDKRAALFEPYARGKGLGDIPGVGLGLYMTQKIARLHAGYLASYPNPEGQGSIFCLRLPLQQVSTEG
jgi:signal transduction histidine kinase/ABC-type nitrate/sulfonate/bicarbonate transport system substrate-binding protein